MQASNPESRFRSGPSDYPGMTVLMSAPRRPRFPDRLPNLLRRQRRVERLDAELAERIHDAVGDAGRPADRTGLAAALGPQRIGAARRGFVQRDLDRRNIVGSRQAVILIARSQ